MSPAAGHRAAAHANLALDDQLCFALYSASLAMGRRYRDLLQALDITYPQYLVMLVLWEGDARRVREIGDRLFLDSATLTPLLKRLETAGLVTRERAMDDERAVIVSLTRAGRGLELRARSVRSAIGKATCLSGRDMDALRQSLHQLREDMLGE